MTCTDTPPSAASSPLEYVVFDLEWNQPAYPEQARRLPFRVAGEIIEIGAVRISGQGEILGQFKSLVRPKYYSRMNARIAKMTGITAAQLKNAPSFPQAITEFRRFCGENACGLTWGPDDLPMLKSNLLLHGLDEQFFAECVNLQTIFNRQVSLESRQWSLTDAVDRLGIERLWEAHDALHDALYTALVAGKLRLAEGIALCRQEDTCLETLRWQNLSTFRALLSRLNEAGVACPVCRRGPLQTANKWLGPRSGKLLCAVRCECGREWFLLCKFQKISGRFQAVRNLFPMTDDRRRQLEKFRQKAAAEKTAAAPALVKS